MLSWLGMYALELLAAGEAANSPVAGILVGLLGFIVAFGLAVFIHELGHFLAAKLFRVPVERFVIGFDKEAMPFLPRCIVEKKIGETTYGLSLVPLGGYVKMSGVVHPEIEKYLEGTETAQQEHTADIDAAVPLPLTRADDAPRPAPPADPRTLQGQALQDMQALYKKPFWQKIIIYGAGVVMNMLLAMVVISVMYARGFYESAPLEPMVAYVEPGSTYADDGVAVGDRVVRVNDKPVSNQVEINSVIGEAAEQDAEAPQISFTLTMQRADSSTYTVPVTVVREPQTAEEAKPYDDFVRTFFHLPAYIEEVIINDPADKAGLRSGDVILAVNDEPISSWWEFQHIVRNGVGQELRLKVNRNDAEREVVVTPRESATEAGVGQIGVMPGNSARNFVKEPFGTALMASPGRIYNTALNYLNGLRNLGGHAIQGNVREVGRQLGGPVGIAQLAYRQSQKGLNDWLRFVIVLNVALAVMNSLPIPVLDGGHIVFAMYEAVFRRPVPAKVLVPLLNGAVIFFLIFFVLVTFNDMLKIFL